MPTLSVHTAIDDVPAREWNRLVDPDAPFLSHEFLAALEHHGCVGEELGWLPRHLVLRNDDGLMVAAAPCYLKLNSYGEFVFDWAWADAYRRSGLAYYPKLVVASPYTPATAPRILTGDAPRRAQYARDLIRATGEWAECLPVSSLHWLFTSSDETRWLEDAGFLRRMGCQFHWENPGYGSFAELLEMFSAVKRKKVKRERRRVREAGIRFRLLRGGEVSDAQWALFHALYRGTFDKRGGIPTLSLGFFREIARTMGDNLLLVLAYHGGDPVAAAFNLVGSRSLYGRHWGCFEEFHSLHFETCYYQGLDFCIANGLKRFEPGAQGEYKISRGFLPTATWSAHWIADNRFRTAIGRFLEQERQGMKDYVSQMSEHSPYKTGPETTR
jgi:predicted N-acyltransferase